MKGGLDVFDFRVDRPRNSRTSYPPLLIGTNQLIIKRTRVGFLSNEPRIFFGDNRKTDNTSGDYYYTYVCKNKDSDINNLISFRKLEDSVNGAPPQIRELTLQEVKQIEPEILLGFYTQYIERCKLDFIRRTDIVFRLMYMRRLFFYLFYHILPVIGEYILSKYFRNITQIRINNSEFNSFMNIIKFLKRINLQEFIEEIKFICNLNEEQYQKLNGDINKNLKDFCKLSPQQEIINIRRSIIQSENTGLINAIGNISLGANPIGLGNQGNQQFPEQIPPNLQFSQLSSQSQGIINLTNGISSSSARTGVNPIGFGNQGNQQFSQLRSQPIPHYNRDSVINLTGDIVSSSARTGVGLMDVVEFIGFVISIPFRIIFFFMQFAG